MTICSIALALGTGQRAGHAKQTGHVFVFGSPPNSVTASAEHLRRRLQLDVTLDPDDGFVHRIHVRTAPISGRWALA